MLLIYVPVFTTRCAYVFDLIFKYEYGIACEVTSDPEIFKAHGAEKINYSFHKIKDEFYISASSLLFERGTKKINIVTGQQFGTTILFAGGESCDVGFDIFAAVFYMVSRYEEYLPSTPDKYGRFKSAESLAYKLNFLQQPVVDRWINVFRKVLILRFPNIKCEPSTFKYITTYDIDIAYAFKGRNILRTIGATVKEMGQLEVRNICKRLACLFKVSKDPWDVYDFLNDLVVKSDLRSIFFILLADYSLNDKNISYRHPLMKKLVAKVSTFSEIGLHPSFRSSEMPQKIGVEKERLENLSGRKINQSRQHYLKFILPHTYNHLIKAGITEDYSMGFADMPGFRAGTSRPFYFYDINKESPTVLRVFPVTVMEGSFIGYMNLSPGEALDQISNLMQEVKNAGGTFISIWHNHTLSDFGPYKGWRYVHDKMIEQILSYA